jgi:hypothetical protein
MSLRPHPLALALAALFVLPVAQQAHAAPSLLAIGTLSGSQSDLSGLNYSLENGQAADLLGGMGSALAWAGGNTFLALPDRGPNAVAGYVNSSTGLVNTLSDTTSYIPRFQTVTLKLTANTGAGLPYLLTPTLTKTTLLSSATPLNYSSSVVNGFSGNPLSGAPTAVQAANVGTSYFSGRSDNFATGLSTNGANARLDTEGIRVSHDGKSVFISDEYGPYVYQFDRATGQRINTITLPTKYAVSNLSAVGDNEITGNTVGRVANKGMEGLAISPDGKTLIAAMQSPLLQDGGTNGAYTRLLSIDIATGQVIKEVAYKLSNLGTPAAPKYATISEIIALNNGEVLVDERDGKGLGDDSKAAFKQIFKFDFAAARDVSADTGATALAVGAASKTLLIDVVAALKANGFTDRTIPAKLEGLAFGDDVVINGVTQHTLIISNDNDFMPTATVQGASVANPNRFFVFGLADSDLAGSSYVAQSFAAPVPEPESLVLTFSGLAVLALWRRRAQAR